ncbi:MAG TPA: hypothetical protein VGO47_05420 [Chlamydiales bacterium]|nr:hypothetical protein [Chlamydiales bacterium]
MLPQEVQLISVTFALGLVTPFLYGIFVVLFITSTYLLILRRMKSTENHKISFKTFLTPIICFNILMFLTVTAVGILNNQIPLSIHISDQGCLLICIRVFQVGAFFNGSITPAYFYADLAYTIEVVKTPFTIASQAIADVLIVRSFTSCRTILMAFIDVPPLGDLGQELLSYCLPLTWHPWIHKSVHY